MKRGYITAKFDSRLSFQVAVLKYFLQKAWGHNNGSSAK